MDLSCCRFWNMTGGKIWTLEDNSLCFWSLREHGAHVRIKCLWFLMPFIVNCRLLPDWVVRRTRFSFSCFSAICETKHQRLMTCFASQLVLATKGKASAQTCPSHQNWPGQVDSWHNFEPLLRKPPGIGKERRELSHMGLILSWQALESNSDRSDERRATLPPHHQASHNIKHCWNCACAIQTELTAVLLHALSPHQRQNSFDADHSWQLLENEMKFGTFKTAKKDTRRQKAWSTLQKMFPFPSNKQPWRHVNAVCGNLQHIPDLEQKNGNILPSLACTKRHQTRLQFTHLADKDREQSNQHFPVPFHRNCRVQGHGTQLSLRHAETVDKNAHLADGSSRWLFRMWSLLWRSAMFTALPTSSSASWKQKKKTRNHWWKKHSTIVVTQQWIDFLRSQQLDISSCNMFRFCFRPPIKWRHLAAKSVHGNGTTTTQPSSVSSVWTSELRASHVLFSPTTSGNLLQQHVVKWCVGDAVCETKQPIGCFVNAPMLLSCFHHRNSSDVVRRIDQSPRHSPFPHCFEKLNFVLCTQNTNNTQDVHLRLMLFSFLSHDLSIFFQTNRWEEMWNSVTWRHAVFLGKAPLITSRKAGIHFFQKKQKGLWSLKNPWNQSPFPWDPATFVKTRGTGAVATWEHNCDDRKPCQLCTIRFLFLQTWRCEVTRKPRAATLGRAFLTLSRKMEMHLQVLLQKAPPTLQNQTHFPSDQQMWRFVNTRCCHVDAQSWSWTETALHIQEVTERAINFAEHVSGSFRQTHMRRLNVPCCNLTTHPWSWPDNVQPIAVPPKFVHCVKRRTQMLTPNVWFVAALFPILDAAHQEKTSNGIPTDWKMICGIADHCWIQSTKANSKKLDNKSHCLSYAHRLTQQLDDYPNGVSTLESKLWTEQRDCAVLFTTTTWEGVQLCTVKMCFGDPVCKTWQPIGCVLKTPTMLSCFHHRSSPDMVITFSPRSPLFPTISSIQTTGQNNKGQTFSVQHHVTVSVVSDCRSANYGHFETTTHAHAKTDPSLRHNWCNMWRNGSAMLMLNRKKHWSSRLSHKDPPTCVESVCSSFRPSNNCEDTWTGAVSSWEHNSHLEQKNSVALPSNHHKPFSFSFIIRPTDVKISENGLLQRWSALLMLNANASCSSTWQCIFRFWNALPSTGAQSAVNFAESISFVVRRTDIFWTLAVAELRPMATWKFVKSDKRQQTNYATVNTAHSAIVNHEQTNDFLCADQLQMSKLWRLLITWLQNATTCMFAKLQSIQFVEFEEPHTCWTGTEIVLQSLFHCACWPRSCPLTETTQYNSPFCLFGPSFCLSFPLFAACQCPHAPCLHDRHFFSWCWFRVWVRHNAAHSSV